VSRLVLDNGQEGPSLTSDRPEVVFVQRGSADVRVEDTILPLGSGDTMTVPRGLPRSYRAAHGRAELILVRGAD
jgi:mannose-6-phosphate isomerase-like protein (cupin superfamily)